MKYIIPAALSGGRLDAVVAAVASLSRSAAEKLIGEEAVLVNGKPQNKKYKVSEGDEVEVTPPPLKEIEALPENIPLSILYEDADILVINKPKGMVVHPAPGSESGTLVNALLYHVKDLSGINGAIRPGIVHRIDKDTSGLLVVAKNDEAHKDLAAKLEVHAVRREYYALVAGGFKEDAGKVDLPIGRHPTDRKKMAVIRDGQHTARPAVTHYEVLERFGGITFLRLQLETGRTHQIRVHMSALGHPLLGDLVYGGGKTAFEKAHPALFAGQALHAGKLQFAHPRTGEEMEFTSPLPEEMQRILCILRQTL